MKISKIVSKDIIDLYTGLNPNNESIEMFNNYVNGKYVKKDCFKVGLKTVTIKLESEAKTLTKTFTSIGAKNIVTALILEGCQNVNLDIETLSIQDRIFTFKHNKFLHVPESGYFLSSEIVYENEEYQVFFIKETETYKAYKI